MESLILTGQFDARDFFLTLFFGSDAWNDIVTSVLYLIGLWMIFRKSGVKSWWALFPVAREYQLARCASREPEGRGLVIVCFLIKVINVFGVGLLEPFLRSGADEVSMNIVVIIAVLTLLLVQIVYEIRVFSGLVDVYGAKKIWIPVWVFFEWVPALIWGFSRRYQPSWKVEDLRAEMERLATHGSSTVMDEGLTVNLNERSVREFFQKKVLLRDIHLSIPQGHMVLLLGGSGAGKTTFLNAINGYEKADAEIMLNGKNLYKDYKKLQYEIGFVPQTEMMRGKDTVSSTLFDASRLRLPKDIPKSSRRQRVNDVMDIFGLQPVKSNLEEKLSGGQKKRLSISMEFISNPSLFILDEPDSGLDGVMARELFEQLRKIADDGKIVIVITHTPDRVIDLFDDVIVLAKDSARTGRLAYYGRIEDARTFFGRESMEEIVKSVNRKEEGGDGLADEFVLKYAEVQNG